MKLNQWFEAIRESARKDQRGEIDIGAILLMGIGMVFLAVGFIVFPLITDACDTLLAYNCSLNATVVAAYFTGFTSIVGITPLLVLIGYLAAAVFSMYLGVKVMKGGAGGTTLDLGTLILLGLSLVFIAIALIILPVVLDGICDTLTPGLSSTYTGLTSILRMTPMLILIAFDAAAVITGFFGMKRLSASST